MTSAAELLALADRIEHEEGSREIDAEIWAAVKGNGQPIQRVGPPTYNVVRLFCNPNPEAVEWIGYDLLNTAERFTTGASFDLTAPMSLVPPGWDHSIIKRVQRPYQGKFPFEVVLYRRVESSTSYDTCGGFGRSQKCALTAAALRAQAAEIE